MFDNSINMSPYFHVSPIIHIQIIILPAAAINVLFVDSIRSKWVTIYAYTYKSNNSIILYQTEHYVKHIVVSWSVICR